MTLTDQAEFVITDIGIHRGPLAWKLGAPDAVLRASAKVFSIRIFDRRTRAANIDATPTNLQRNRKPIEFDRSAFGELTPVATSPDMTG